MASLRAREAKAALAPVPGGHAVQDADPLASALAAYASALGLPVEAASLMPWIALIPVLLLEVGSAFAIVVYRAAAALDPRANAPLDRPLAGERSSPAMGSIGGSIGGSLALADCSRWCADNGLANPSPNAVARAVGLVLAGLGGRRGKVRGLAVYKGVALAGPAQAAATAAPAKTKAGARRLGRSPLANGHAIN